MSDYSVAEIKNIVRPIAAKYGVKKISLFGSRARGDNNFHSDYDFLITKGRVHTLWLFMSLVDELEQALNSHGDVLNDTSADRDLVSVAEREGIVLYGE
ncbi:MAG: nucleotidyltransferase domain-containing protein [Synergistaceae bacterium]|nr:nucleotidyltransferase domain-containing protein [Synergistaceae bacterium]